MTEESQIEVLLDGSRRGDSSVLEKIRVSDLKNNLETFSNSIVSSFRELSRDADGAKLSQVQVQVSIGAEGSVKLLGTGGSASAGASITLTYDLD